MKNLNKKHLLFLVPILGLALCFVVFFFWQKLETKDQPNYLTEETSEQVSFEQFTEDLFETELNSSTINLHYTLANPEKIGIDSTDVSFGSYSADAINDRIHLIQSDFSYLSGVNRDLLTDDQKLTYDILYDYFSTEVSALDLTYYSELLSPSCGIQAQLPILLAEYTFYDTQDIKDYLTLLSRMDDYYESILTFETEKSKKGLFMPDYAAEDVIDQCEEFVKDPENSYLVEVFNDKIDAFDGLSDSDKSDYKEANEALLYSDVVPAYETLIEGLTNLIGTGVNEQGLCYYAEGKEFYTYLVKYSTGSSKTLQELEEMTDNKILSDLTQMINIASENPDAITSAMEDNFSLSDPEDILQDLQQKIADDFPKSPSVNYTIKYVHESLEKYASPAFYLTPPIDLNTENLIYINQGTQMTHLDLYTTLAHEGYPGHLYQNTYFDETDENAVRSILNYGGYSEGWATYVEMLSYSYADMDSDVASLLQLNNAITLGLYARIDMGIHYDGWTLDQTMEYLNDYGITNKENVTLIYHIIVEEPANYVQYYIGYLEILNLKQTSQETLGNRFNLKNFHTFLLDTGPAPFSIIEDYMQDWMLTQ